LLILLPNKCPPLNLRNGFVDLDRVKGSFKGHALALH